MVLNNVILTCSKEHLGALSFATDAWSSPNHKAYVAVTVHFEQDGVPVSMLLDIVEVPCSHSGLNLAKAFANILEDFGVSDKVSTVLLSGKCSHTLLPDTQHYLRQCIQQRHDDSRAFEPCSLIPWRIQPNSMLQPRPQPCREDCHSCI